MTQPALVEKALGLVVEFESGEDLLVTDAAARVLVHFVDELFDRVLAVPDHVPGDALGDGDESAIDHEHPVVVALDETLDQDRAAALQRVVECDANMFFVIEVDRYASTMVRAERLEDDRVSDPNRCPHRAVGVVDDFLSRNREA